MHRILFNNSHDLTLDIKTNMQTVNKKIAVILQIIKENCEKLLAIGPLIA